MDSQLTVYTCQGLKSNQLKCNVSVRAVHHRYAFCSHHKVQMRHEPFAKLTEQEVEIIVMLRERALVHAALEHIANTPIRLPRRNSRQSQRRSSVSDVDSDSEFDDEDTSQLSDDVNRMFTELRLAISRT
jgi:hypothetical protein